MAVSSSRTFARDGFRLRNPKTPYLAVTVLLYGVIYFAIARFEPVYGASQGPDQDFLLLSIVIVIFHNVQYVGLVWFHNRNRYAGAARARPGGRRQSRAGAVPGRLRALLAGGLRRRSPARPACSRRASGSRQRRLGPVSWNQIGLCLWWGLAMNHYYLDQKIWRIRGDDELKRSLRLA